MPEPRTITPALSPADGTRHTDAAGVVFDDALARDRARRRWALAVNVIAPGAGLVILRREWLGLTLAVLFVLLSQIAVYGLLFCGPDVPPMFARGAAIVAVVVWGFAQWLGWARARRVLGERARREITVMLKQADQAATERRFADAIDLLRVAVQVNDEDLSVRLALARLLTVVGRFADARREWETVQDLDVTGAVRTEAVSALERLPDG